MRIRTFTAVVAAAVAAVVLLAGCGGDSDDKGSGATTTTAAPLAGKDFVDLSAEAAPEVDAVDNNFKPEYVEVKKGTTVTFKNDGRNTHNVIPTEDGAFPAVPSDAFEPGLTATVTFDEAGDYPYYCSLHGTPTRGMIGGVRVVE